MKGMWYKASCCSVKAKIPLPACVDVEALVKELNETPGRLLPGVKIVPYYDRTGLIHTTTETVRENLFHGMALVTIVLLMFLGNVRTASHLAIMYRWLSWLPFAALYYCAASRQTSFDRAVDFGILVDSSVIMVENVYRHLTHGTNAELPIKQRVLKAATEVQRSLLFSTGIMVWRVLCAVYDGRSCWTDLPTDGAYLCLCSRRRAAAGDHAVASTVRNAARSCSTKT